MVLGMARDPMNINISKTLLVELQVTKTKQAKILQGHRVGATGLGFRKGFLEVKCLSFGLESNRF